MEHLYTPWRSPYIGRARHGKSNRCIFCDYKKSKHDSKNLVLARSKHSLILMNLYPYNDGHLMVAPYRHAAHPKLLSPIEWADLHESARRAISVLEKVLKPDGFNLGMNLGRVSGAGLDKHLHLHVVPRWSGDTNFLPVVGKTKLMNQNLQQLYKRLKKRLMK